MYWYHTLKNGRHSLFRCTYHDMIRTPYYIGQTQSCCIGVVHSYDRHSLWLIIVVLYGHIYYLDWHTTHSKQIELYQHYIWTVHELYMDCTWTVLEPYMNDTWTVPVFFGQFMYSSLWGICTLFKKSSPFLKTLSYAPIFENSFLCICSIF